MVRHVLGAGGARIRLFSQCALFAFAVSCNDGTAAANVTGEMRVIITPATAEIPIGGTVTLPAEVVDADGHPGPEAQISWGSESPSIASVASNGTVTGVSVGTAVITA